MCVLTFQEQFNQGNFQKHPWLYPPFIFSIHRPRLVCSLSFHDIWKSIPAHTVTRWVSFALCSPSHWDSESSASPRAAWPMWPVIEKKVDSKGHARLKSWRWKLQLISFMRCWMCCKSHDLQVVDSSPYFKPNCNPWPVSKSKDKCTAQQHNLHATTLLHKHGVTCTA